MNPRRSLGRMFNCSAMRSHCRCVSPLRLVPLGRYCRMATPGGGLPLNLHAAHRHGQQFRQPFRHIGFQLLMQLSIHVVQIHQLDYGVKLAGLGKFASLISKLLAPICETIPLLQHQTPGAVFAEFGEFLFLEDAEGFAGEVRGINDRRDEDVARVVAPRQAVGCIRPGRWRDQRRFCSVGTSPIQHGENARSRFCRHQIFRIGSAASSCNG